MFLGIRYDLWHGILAALLFLAVFFTGFFTILPVLTLVIGPGFSILLISLSGIFVALLLQSLNEAVQAIDPEVEKQYGSWQNFQKNSKRDWKYFLMGIITGQILSGIFMVIYMYSHS